MTTEHSTYTYESGAQETVKLTRGPGTPHGHALLTIGYSDAPTVYCYVNTAWLRDRLDDLGEPRPAESRPLTPDAITDEMVDRAHRSLISHHGYGRVLRSQVREALTAALTEPPARPEGAEDIEALIREAEKAGQGADDEALANYLAAHLTDPTRKEA